MDQYNVAMLERRAKQFAEPVEAEPIEQVADVEEVKPKKTKKKADTE